MSNLYDKLEPMIGNTIKKVYSNHSHEECIAIDDDTIVLYNSNNCGTNRSLNSPFLPRNKNHNVLFGLNPNFSDTNAKFSLTNSYSE